VIALLAAALLQARVVTGVITHIERDWRYEAPCGLIASILHQCEDTQAFTAELREASGTERILFFRRGPGPHPAVGDSGVWVLHRAAVYPLLECAQRGALTSTGCLSEEWWVLESDADMPEQDR
jgi:hypothetical protein